MTALFPAAGTAWARVARLAIVAVLAPALACAHGEGPTAERGHGRAAPGAGVVSGSVVLEGPVPASWRAESDAWAGLQPEPPADWNGTPPREIEVDAGGGVRGVAVWLEPVEEADESAGEAGGDRFHVSIVDGDVAVGVRLPAMDDGDAGVETGNGRVRGEPATVLLKGSCFWPMMVVIPRGGTVRFVNADARLHHVQFLSGIQPRSLMIGPGESAEVEFREPELIRLTCNDHAFMRADLIVTPTPWASVTDAAGRFEIPNVPPARYSLRFAHHRLSDAGSAIGVEVGPRVNLVGDLRAARGRWPY